MIRKILCIIFVVFATGSLFAQNGAIKGKILDAGSGEAVPFANVVVELNGNQVGGGVSDFDGNYIVKPVPAGRFTVKASCVGYKILQMNDVVVYNDKIRFLDLNLNGSTQEIEEIDVVAYVVPLIDKDNTTTGGTVTSEDISKMAGRSAESVASTVGGVYQEDGEVKSVRGAREDATVYYIDGVKVRGAKSLPKSSIAEVSVVTGGVPAKYGDATGGVISIVTKGASRSFFGGVELATSKFLDPYNNSIAGVNLSGPIIQRKVVDPDNPEVVTKEPLVGFFAAAEYGYALDRKPSAVGFYKVKDDILDSITRTPLYLESDGVTVSPTAQRLSANDFKKQKVRENVAGSNASASLKFDIQPVKNLVFTIGGNYQYSNGRGLPSYHYYSGSGNYLSGEHYEGMLNYKNNSKSLRNTFRTYARITHRIGGSTNEESASIIKNAYYQIQFDYSKDLYKSQNEKFKEDFFKYGYIGKFNTYQTASYAWGQDTSLMNDPNQTISEGFLLTGYYDTLVTFQRSELNPELANYTDWYYNNFDNPKNQTQIISGNGLLNGDRPSSILDLAVAPGVPRNSYEKMDNDQFRVSASGAADIKDHEISLGFEYEKRTDRYYSLEPAKLWLIGRQNLNNHISELDFANPIIGYRTDLDGNTFYNDTISYNRLYNESTQTKFAIDFREQNGIAKNSTDWVDIDSYDPEKIKIDYFSADEILSYQPSLPIIAYYGYDIYGNKLKSNQYPTFEEYFTDTYERGGKQWYSRQRAPFQPIYAAGYIQDKFAFNDLIFNVGVRVDMYDANQKVQKDPYLTHTAYTVGDNQGIIAETNVPSNIPSDAVVYVNDESDPKSIKGYRSGSKWYDASGNQINNPVALYENGAIHPYLTNPNDAIGEQSFLNAFEDYKPDISVMPRISFSFPISDEALFFAHYDILTKRPSSGSSQISPFSYLFMEQRSSRFFTNPSLTSEKTIDYELGFQQKLNNKSSLKISGFYREQRDMVQAIQLMGAYPINIKTYGNIDFGTVKGFTTTYDLRRTGNVKFRASYTLTFANATGSDATTAASLINAGLPNIRTTLPTDFDQRHAFSILLDYRFSSGKAYNGPRWFGKDIFANAGANFTVNTGSGTPYTIKDINSHTVQGSINGSIMPWRTTVGMKIDKSFTIKLGKEEGAKTSDLNVYLDITNLLNAKNVMRVYETSGNADDDAYLTSQKGISNISNSVSPESLVDYYTMLMDNRSHYSLPRQIRLGVVFSF